MPFFMEVYRYIYVTLIDIFGGDDGAQSVTVASECDVLEARKEAIQTQKTYNIVAAAILPWKYIPHFD